MTEYFDAEDFTFDAGYENGLSDAHHGLACAPGDKGPDYERGYRTGYAEERDKED